MHKKSLNEINLNLEAIESSIENFENKKEKLKLNPIKSSHIYLGECIGMSAAMAMTGTVLLDASAFIMAGIGGGIVGALTPYIVKQIRIGDLNYQIFMNGLIVKDLEKEEAEVNEKVKVFHR